MFAPRHCALLVAVLAVACDRGSAPARTGPDWITAEAKPVDLDLTLDSSAAVSRVFTERGGTLIATGADGIRYRLRIPEGAVSGFTEITMTPVALVRGLPLSGGNVAAVDLKPDGLQLLKPATLTISNAPRIPVPEQVAYAYSSGGRDAHGYPLTRDPKRIEMQVVHFSGYGFGQAPANDAGRLALLRSAAIANRYAAQLAAAVDRLRSALERGESDATIASIEPDMQALAVEFYKSALRPIMQIALTDLRMYECCMDMWTAWERQNQLTIDGGDVEEGRAPGAMTELDQLRRESYQLMERIQDFAFEKTRERAIELCRNHDLSGADLLLANARAKTLLRGSKSVADPLPDLRNCLQFEVEFRSAFDNSAPGETRFAYGLQADAVTEFDLQRGITAPSTPLPYHRFEASGSPKESVAGRATADPRSRWLELGNTRISSAGTRPGTFVVHDIRQDSTVKVDAKGVNCEGRDTTIQVDSVVAMAITFSVGEPTELVNHASAVAGTQRVEVNGWLFHWSQAHADAELPAQGARDGALRLYRMKLRESEPGVWRIDFDDSSPPRLGYSLVEAGSLIVRHTPQ